MTTYKPLTEGRIKGIQKGITRKPGIPDRIPIGPPPRPTPLPSNDDCLIYSSGESHSYNRKEQYGK